MNGISLQRIIVSLVVLSLAMPGSLAVAQTLGIELKNSVYLSPKLVLGQPGNFQVFLYYACFIYCHYGAVSQFEIFPM